MIHWHLLKVWRLDTEVIENSPVFSHKYSHNISNLRYIVYFTQKFIHIHSIFYLSPLNSNVGLQITPIIIQFYSFIT